MAETPASTRDATCNEWSYFPGARAANSCNKGWRGSRSSASVIPVTRSNQRSMVGNKPIAKNPMSSVVSQAANARAAPCPKSPSVPLGRLAHSARRPQERTPRHWPGGRENGGPVFESRVWPPHSRARPRRREQAYWCWRPDAPARQGFHQQPPNSVVGQWALMVPKAAMAMTAALSGGRQAFTKRRRSPAGQSTG